MDIYTIGVYGKTEEDFFNKITSAGVTYFVDVRLRRGMRGTQYKFVNSLYLQKKLDSLGVKYSHYKDLAPTKEIRSIQATADKQSGDSKRARDRLSLEFCNKYNNEILKNYDFSQLTRRLPSETICFFCVERDCLACHRSLISEYLTGSVSGLSVIHL